MLWLSVTMAVRSRHMHAQHLALHTSGKHGGQALHGSADGGGWPEVNGNQAVHQIRPLLRCALGRPNVTLGHLYKAPTQSQACHGRSHHAYSTITVY